MAEIRLRELRDPRHDPPPDTPCSREPGQDVETRDGGEHVLPRYMVIFGLGITQRWIICRACAPETHIAEIVKIERSESRRQKAVADEAKLIRNRRRRHQLGWAIVMAVVLVLMFGPHI